MIQCDHYPYKKTQREDHITKETREWADTSISQGTSRIAGDHQSLRRDKDGVFSRAFGQNMTLPYRFQTSSLQNYERINYCCLKSPSLQSFVMAALGNWYTMKHNSPAAYGLPTQAKTLQKSGADLTMSQ